MKSRVLIFSLVVMGMFFSASSFDISFSAPAQWMTLRDGEVVVRFHADTSMLPDNQVVFSLHNHTENSERRLSTKTVTVDGYTGEYTIGTVEDAFIGGSQWLVIQWRVPGTDFKGTLGPLGIADLERIGSERIAGAKRFENELSDSEIMAAFGDDHFITVGGVKVALGWNDRSLFVAYDKHNSAGELQLAFDLKCGKSAFLSWADRFLVYNAEKESVSGVHYRRKIRDEKVEYAERSWGQGIITSSGENILLVSIPWDEMGVIAFQERVIGLAAFSFDQNGAAKINLPSSALKYAPGTWGDFILEK